MTTKIHATIYSTRRRNTIILCDGDTVLPFTQTTQLDAEITCQRCKKLATTGTHHWDDASGKWIAQ